MGAMKCEVAIVGRAKNALPYVRQYTYRKTEKKRNMYRKVMQTITHFYLHKCACYSINVRMCQQCQLFIVCYLFLSECFIYTTFSLFSYARVEESGVYFQ